MCTQSTEAVGISIIEAMVAGCVLGVSRDGGPQFDVLDGKQGEFSFSYGSLGEAAHIIESLLEDEDVRLKFSSRASERAGVFDKLVFERKILGVVKKTFSWKFGQVFVS